MGPKKGTGGETSKSVRGKIVEKEDFHPNQVSDRDKFLLDLKHPNASWEMIKIILYSRFCIGYMGDKCKVKKSMPQLKCGESIDYKEGCFLIVTLCLGESLLVDFLIHKPSIYMVGVGVKENWWKVTDFEEHTGFRFSSADTLYFKSRCKGVPIDFSYELVAECVLRIFNGSNNKMEDTEDYFKRLCVVICESIRFDEILRVMFKVMQNAQKSYTLNKLQIWLILNWKKLSLVWVIFDLGYGWNLKNKLTIPGNLSVLWNPSKVKELIGVIKYPSAIEVLKAVEPLQEIVDDGKDGKVLLVGLDSIEVLEKIVQKEVDKRSNQARQEGILNPEESGRNFKFDVEFVKEKKRKVLKKLCEDALKEPES